MAKILFLVKSTGLYERHGMMQIAAVLKTGGHCVRLLKTEGRNLRNILGFVQAYAPDILAYSTMTGEHRYLVELNRKIKEQVKTFSLFGGPHATFFPEIIKKDGVDAVCIGEGEYPMLELANKIDRCEEITSIENLWVKTGKEIRRNPLRPLIEDLDILPFADREVMYEADIDLRHHKTRMFFIGRGCPYRCTYCFNHQYNELYRGKGRIIRRRSVELLIEEIIQVRQRYPLEFIHFGDDIFCLDDREWLEEFSTAYAKRVAIPFMCHFRANLVNEENVALLKRAGCYSGWIGVECGDEGVSRDILQRNLTNRQILNACSLLKKHGIRFGTQNMVGMPVVNSLAVDLKTLALNYQCRPDFAWSSILFPYPRTEIGRYCLEKGFFSGDFDNIPETNKSESVLAYDNPCDKKAIQRLHKLFGLAVGLPVLRPFIRILLRLPLDRLYFFVFYLWYGYCLRFRLEKGRKGIGDIIRLGKNFFSYILHLDRPLQ